MTINHIWMFSAFLFTSQLVLLVILALRKHRLSAKEQTISNQYESLTDSFSSYMMDPEDDRFIHEISGITHQTIVLERLLNGYVSITKGSITSPLVARLSEDFLTETYTKQLAHSNWAMRMNTLYFIEDFHMQSLIPQLKEKLRNTTRLDQETQQLIRTLASLNESDTLLELAQFPSAPVRLYQDVFKRLEEPVMFEQLGAVLDDKNHPTALREAAISYIGTAGLTRFLPQIEDELQSPVEEIRIQALKAISHLHYLSEPNLLTPFFHSSAWQERMFASQIAGRLQLSRFKEMLGELMGDSVWWVRYSSAEALVQFSDGDILLDHLSVNHPDRYARDMATQWKSSLLGSEE